MLGMPPTEMLENGLKTSKYFHNEQGTFIFKEQFEYEYENNTKIPPNKNYFKYKTLRELITLNQMRVSNTETMSADKVRESLYDFLKHCLAYDPKERLTPDQALSHPFITDRSLEEYILPPRLYPYVEYGKTVTLGQNEFVSIMLEKMPELKYIKGSYNTMQYFNIFKTALNNGHVVNIMADSPLRGTITPPSLPSVFQPTITPTVQQKLQVPRHAPVQPLKVPQSAPILHYNSPENIPIHIQHNTSNPRIIQKKDTEGHKKGNSLPSSIALDANLKSPTHRTEKTKSDKKEEKERSKQIEKQMEKERKKEFKKEEKLRKSLSRDSSKERIDKDNIGIKIKKRTFSQAGSEGGSGISSPARASSVDGGKKKRFGFNLFKKDKKESRDSKDEDL
ncbi:hypothetical protein QTN25_000656 [Entamoeba marina]